MKRIKKPFTLLELLICLTVLSLIGSLFAVKGKKLFDQYAFKQEVSKVRDILQLAKEYAFCYQSDVEVVFSKNTNHFFIEIRTDEPLLKKESFFIKKYRLAKVSSIDLDGSSLLFSGSGWVFPKSDLVIKGNRQTVIINL